MTRRSAGTGSIHSRFTAGRQRSRRPRGAFRSGGSPPSRRRRRGPARLIVGGLLLLAIILLGVAGGRWLLEQGVAIGPTPTATSSRAATVSPTIDFRATHNIEDLITQQAQRIALMGLNTPTPDRTSTPTETPTSQQTAVQPTVFVPLPVVVAPGISTSTPTPVPTTTPTVDRSGTPQVASPTPTPAPATLTVAAMETATALAARTATPTSTPTASPTPTPVPAGTPQLTVMSLQATLKQATGLYMGPSSLYTVTATLASDQAVTLEGRNISGEWIYLCCVEDREGWVRQAFLRIENNTLPAHFPDNADPNDVRWLNERTPTVALPNPPPTPTPIPPRDYPLFRHDPAAQARVDTVFSPPLTFGWLDPGQAFRSMSSPALVVGPSVMASSEDQRIYSFDRNAGNQRWRYTIDGVVSVAPAVQDSVIYLVDVNGRVLALQDQGNQAVLVWRSTIPTQPSDGINLRGDRIFLPGVNHRLYALNRANGDQIWEFPTSGNYLHYPAIGDQLVYIGDGDLYAVDVYSGTAVWQNSQIPGVSAPPVYSRPGIKALAELYVADEVGNIHSFDANTGEKLWQYVSSERTTALALDDTRLYASGDGFVKALDRRNGTELWRYRFVDQIVGGPIAGNGRILFVSKGGALQILDANQGVLMGNATIPTQVSGAPAISGSWIFVPGADGSLYSLRGSD